MVERFFDANLLPHMRSALLDARAKQDFDSLCDVLRHTIDALELPWQVPVPVQRLHDDARVPIYAHLTDAGCDIFVRETFILEPQQQLIMSTGLAFAIPFGWQFEIRPKSGLSSRTKLRIANSPATIDSGYRDELGVIIENTALGGGHLIFCEGEKIAQIVLMQTARCDFINTPNVKAIGTDRGGGFGSTGK